MKIVQKILKKDFIEKNLFNHIPERENDNIKNTYLSPIQQYYNSSSNVIDKYVVNYSSKTLSYNNSYNYENNKEECIKKR